MNNFEIDKAKIPEVKKLINFFEELMETNEYSDELRKELDKIESRLFELSGYEINIMDYAEYWSWTNLDDVVEIILTPKPQKCNLTDEEIGGIIYKIKNAEYKEAESRYMERLLELETGLFNIGDYLRYGKIEGLHRNSSSEEVTKKVIEDRNKKREFPNEPDPRVIYL